MKKFILTALTATALMGTTVFANITDFADYNTDFGYGKISGHWGENDLTILHDNGGLNGTAQADGSLRLNPNKEVTAAEFLAMLFQATGTTVTQHAGLSWVENMYQNAVDIGIMEVFNTTGNYDSPILNVDYYYITTFEKNNMNTVLGFTRLDASRLMLAVDNLRGGTLYSNDNNSTDAYYYKSAMLRGLMSSDGDPRIKDSLTRTEAATLVNRLVGNTERVYAVTDGRPDYESYEHNFPVDGNVEIEILTEGNASLKERWFYTIASATTSGTKLSTNKYPQVGDMINGKPVTIDPWTGVMAFGEGQTGWVTVDMGTQGYVSTDKDRYMTIQNKVVSLSNYCYSTQEWNLIRDKAVDHFLETTGITLADIPMDIPEDYVPLYMDAYGNQVMNREDATFQNFNGLHGYYEWTVIKS